MANLPQNNMELQLAAANEAQLTKDAAFFKELSAYINELITTNFEQLLALLYRVDVSEKKLKTLLAEPAENLSSDVIARLLIERQLEKIISRRDTKIPPEEFDEEERW